MSTPKGIKTDKNIGLLTEHWDHIAIYQILGKSILSYMGWVKTKGNKATRNELANLQEVKEEFLVSEKSLMIRTSHRQ